MQPETLDHYIAPAPHRRELCRLGLYPDLSKFGTPKQAQLDWFKANGVAIEALAKPEPVRVTNDNQIVFPEDRDAVFWQPKTSQIVTWSGRAFALGQNAISKAGTYVFDRQLQIHADPLEWLRQDRRGIVVLEWTRAFDMLRDCPRIAVSERVLHLYRQHMKPAHMPELFVIPEEKAAAA